jgi:hypothetical protein
MMSLHEHTEIYMTITQQHARPGSEASVWQTGRQDIRGMKSMDEEIGRRLGRAHWFPPPAQGQQRHQSASCKYN